MEQFGYVTVMNGKHERIIVTVGGSCTNDTGDNWINTSITLFNCVTNEIVTRPTVC